MSEQCQANNILTEEQQTRVNAGADRFNAYQESVMAEGGKVTVVTNSDCVMTCREYDIEVNTFITQFDASKNDANIADTLIIKCGETGCSMMLEKYVDTVSEVRRIRNGMLSSNPPRCEVVLSRRQSRQED